MPQATRPSDPQVIVVGGGPVGLALSCQLARAGIAVLTLEARTNPDINPRAGSIGPLAFESLARLGLGADILQAEQETLAHYARLFSEWSARSGADQQPARTAPKEHFGGLERIDASRRSQPWRRRVRIEQPELETILRAAALDSGVDLQVGHEAVAVHQDNEQVHVKARTADGLAEFSCDYLVGCDGYRSVVREVCGFDFPGTDATVTGRMAVCELTDLESLEPGIQFTPRGLYVHGLGVNRLSTVEFDGPPTDEEPLNKEELERSIRYVADAQVTVRTMDHGMRWTDTARQATTYRNGRVLLAGDAAHVYAPVGGQGLNVGLVDAANLGWKLVAELQGWAAPDLLDTYTLERHGVAARLLQNTRAQIALMRPDPQSAALRELVDELLDLDDVHRRIADMLAGMDIRYDIGDTSPMAGTIVGDLALDPLADAGESTSLWEIWPQRGGLLLDRTGSDEIAEAVTRRDHITYMAVAADATETDALLLRPDGCIVWLLPAGAEFSPSQFQQACDRWFPQTGKDPL
ncbi:FAD-dependent monooxygenase [Streptomyces sp. NPDC001139]